MTNTDSSRPSTAPHDNQAVAADVRKNAVTRMNPSIISPVENVAIGALAGMIEIVIQQPTIYWKNTIQARLPVSMNPMVWYRGVAVNIGATAPSTSIQFMANGMFSNVLSGTGARELSDLEKTGAAGLAGAVSVIISGPAELVVVHQQRTGLNMFKTAGGIVKDLGFRALYKGSPFQAVRDASWCIGYIQLAPFAKKHLRRNFPDTFGAEGAELTLTQDITGTVVSGICAGLISVAITQPVDTIKTVMQGDLYGDIKYPNAMSTFRTLWKEGGNSLKLLYGGVGPRAIRLVGGVIILSEAKRHLEAAAVDMHNKEFSGLL